VRCDGVSMVEILNILLSSRTGFETYCVIWLPQRSCQSQIGGHRSKLLNLLTTGKPGWRKCRRMTKGELTIVETWDAKSTFTLDANTYEGHRIYARRDNWSGKLHIRH